MSLSNIPISTIFLFPTITSGPWDYTKPVKTWSMDPDEHKYDLPQDPDFVVFDYYTIVNGVPTKGTKLFSRTDAVSVNIQPPNFQWPTNFISLLTTITPLDLSKIPLGYQIGLNLMRQLELVPIVSPTIPFTQSLADAIMQILVNTSK